MYSFAIIAWHLLSCGDEFFQMEVTRLYVQIVDYHRRPTLSESISLEFKTLIESCWHPTPSMRPSFWQIQASLQVLLDQRL